MDQTKRKMECIIYNSFLSEPQRLRQTSGKCREKWSSYNVYVQLYIYLYSSFFFTRAFWFLPVLVECRTRDRKIASSNPGRSGGRIFFSRVNFVCWLLFGVRSTPVLPHWHVKDPGHSAKSAGGRLHLNTHTPCPGIVREPFQKMSSHATRQGTFGHSRRSSLSHWRLTLT